ncbi:MAG: hypothetical protein GW917_03800 [Bdellovibrionales bacterium]|nr:hypothetical protein [Bdellovibrionales bacterium]
MKLQALILFVFTLILPQMSLAQPELTFSDEIKAQFEWVSNPQVGSESLLHLKFTDTEGNPVELSADPSVVLWMPDMGHGSAPTSVEKNRDAAGNVVAGEYQISKIYFVMPGLWEVRVERQISENAVETQSFTIEL